MAATDTRPNALAITLRVLAHLLDYPDASLREQLQAMHDALHAQGTLGSTRLAEIDALIDELRCAHDLEAEAVYVDMFDRGRGTALHLFEHVHGDSRDRGPAMIDLIKTYEQAGLYLTSGELPDHLSVVLEYASTQPPASSVEFLRELTHILRHLFSALTKRESAYASVMAALLELSGQPVREVQVPQEPGLDETWTEPAVFNGCSPDGQRRSDEPRPIRIVRTQPTSNSAQPAHGASA
jgi:nitrate reductase molybdenum cofactor assembly chaperone NarJ/NarW